MIPQNKKTPHGIKSKVVKNKTKKSIKLLPLANTIALIGNPNTGKSTIFNYLTGSKQKTSNYPGATIEKKTADIVFKNHKITFVDLPGCYSLITQSKDEQVVFNYLQSEEKPDAILFILDATNLKRNLYLLSQVLELKIPVIIALSMMDLLDSMQIKLDIEQLAVELQIPIIPIIGSNKESLDILKESLFTTSFVTLEPFIIPKLPIDKNSKLSEKVLIPQARYKWAQDIISKVEVRLPKKNTTTWTDKIDNILISKVAGFIIFFGLIALMFQLIYSWSQPLMDSIEMFVNSIKTIVANYLPENSAMRSLIGDGMIGGVGSIFIFLPQIVILFILVTLLEDSGYLVRVAFLMDRLFSWTGLNGRSFIPLLSCFACAVPGIMSTRIISDYKTRLITVLILPLVSCSARLPVYVLLIGAFVQPTYGVFISVLVFLLAHLIGPVIAVLLAAVFNHKFLQSEKTIFFLEMPPYRLPSLKLACYRGYTAGKDFILNAGGIILVLSIIVWLLTYFPHSENIKVQLSEQYRSKIVAVEQELDHLKSKTSNEYKLTSDKLLLLYKNMEMDLRRAYLEDSYLGRLGKSILPIFEPLGYDWKITVAILGSFPARELMVSTLGIIYNVEDSDNSSDSLRDKLRHAKHQDGTPVYTILVAISLIIFFALCSQCMSTLAIIKKELNSYKWALFTFCYMTALAYFMALMVYQVGKYFL